MKITKLELKNFKRFDDLTIDMTAFAEPAKLVLLIGTNGSGKSSVFDALEVMNKITRNIDFNRSDLYYRKKKGYDFEIDLIGEFKDQSGKFITHISTAHRNTFLKSPFYGRTSFRQTPKLTRTASGQVYVDFDIDSDRPETFIDHDNRFENDIEKISSSILTDLFGNNTTQQILESYINPINRAFENIFGAEDGLSIKLLSIKPPLDYKIAEILFMKGSSSIQYDYLSSGEKEIFNVLLDLLVRKDYFPDAVYFLDEIDLHLNTYLQKSLLKEITENWIPDNCQLWTASHSLGFIEYANETKNAAIIDFDNLNFDVRQVITPSQKNNFDVFEIAVSKEFLANLFKGKKIIFSENSDTPLYNNLSIENTVFFNARDKADVFYKSKNTPSYYGLIDRDYLTDGEIKELSNEYKNLFILRYYSIENYLFHPDNLEEYYKTFQKDFDRLNYVNSIKNEWLKIRDKILVGVLGARGGYPFYKENGNDEKLKAFKSNSDEILPMFDKNADFENFYKIFPAKDYGTEIKERQNLNRINLAQTTWFKNKIKEVLNK